MVTIENLRALAMSLPETTEEPHFAKTSFRVRKKIFATYDEKSHLACLKLSEIDQDVFVAADRNHIRPVDNKWGKQGWTLFEIEKVHKDLLVDALSTAYCGVAPKKLQGQIKMDDKD